MKVQAPFGFVTSCHAGDKFMVQATLASMRHYCPTVPICLTVDGDFDVSDLEKEYDLIILRVSELPSSEMRNFVSGNLFAKIAAMWEGPFEFYIWLDSDAIVWGDFTSQVRKNVDFQIFWNEVSPPADTKEIPSWLVDHFFDPQKLRLFDSKFEWRGNILFCSGAFACRRNVISFSEWKKVASWGMRKYPGDQGILNYLVHAKVQRGEIKIGAANLQHIPGHHGIAELEQDCAGGGWRFPKVIQRPRVAHFPGRKPPFWLYRKMYRRPFTIARLEHYRRYHGSLGAWLAVLNEDRRALADKVKRRLERYASKILKK